MTLPEVQEAGLVEGGEMRAGSVAAAAMKNDRCVAHTMLLCTNRKGIDMFSDKRKDLVKVRYKCVIISVTERWLS